MKLFLSWSGDRSKNLASYLRHWIPQLLQHVEPWVSETDLSAGGRWADQIATELEGSNFGILCVTQENVDSPWILFEAGSLAKSLKDCRVIPYLLDLEYRDLIGPLAQFQAKKACKESTLEMVLSINEFSGTRVPDSNVKKLFKLLWPQLESSIKLMPASSNQRIIDRPSHEIMEDLVKTVRSIDQRMRGIERGFLFTNCDLVVRNPELPANQILLDLINQVFESGDEFTLSEAYSLFVYPLSNAYPKNTRIKAKIRQKLQELRDNGYLDFVNNRGTYCIQNTEYSDSGNT